LSGEMGELLKPKSVVVAGSDESDTVTVTAAHG
jgi:hypothetical protein